MENKLAKALYDNKAECADELAFRKGDIITVVDHRVAGTSGWWMCSLHGRKGLAPANRLQLLPQKATAIHSFTPVIEKSKFPDGQTSNTSQNIYQIPSLPRTSASPAYERMDPIYKVPSAPLSASKAPSALVQTTEGPDGHKLPLFWMGSSPQAGVYDVPNQPRRASLFNVSTTPRLMARKNSLISVSEREKRLDTQACISRSCPEDSYVYAVPPTVPQDPSYDIPIPSSTEVQQKMIKGYTTLPIPCKPEWIYDIPVSPEKQNPHQSSCDSLPCMAGSQLYDTLPVRGRPMQIRSPASSLYDVPTSHPADVPCPPKVLSKMAVYDQPPTPRLSQESICTVPPQEESQTLNEPPGDHMPLECRGDSNGAHEHTRASLHRVRKALAFSPFYNQSGSGDSPVQDEDERGQISRLSAVENQRISMASSSSTSSCDSLTLNSSSPEPLREVTLSQDEASRRLLDLQVAVCSNVSRLMEFVSSRWRSKEHLEKHLEEVRKAAEAIACSVEFFLNFAMDVKGNACRLTDANLKARLFKQLSIVEDSGVILQQTVSDLNIAGWPLHTLCQDPGQVQTPDQLERFVMVARTVPEDVKRLVSIINANGKLLFRAPQKEPELPNSPAQPELKKSPHKPEQGQDSIEDDNDYVELQAKNDHENQQTELQQDSDGNVPPASNNNMGENNQLSSESTTGTEEHHHHHHHHHHHPSLSEHCRLYFGALNKAIAGFVDSLRDGHPPEKFISHSKLVIMVGQRLVDTLCKEAHNGGSSQSLLCKSNHLCALLKQLAVATKKAALHFPDKQAVHEAQDFAKELAQRAQHFRISLEL
ncbi:cas scaffolding protein family member 4 [Thalassophryne amazonica]|uniref:cas scaffolding protein family member 4 n=1 Tax=Thalassophryne amazonica TaxID=390379 RepID=UPI0014708DAC|nr:cas scaffolding protein family member 4 [Thalassophryne amazonica]